MHRGAQGRLDVGQEWHPNGAEPDHPSGRLFRHVFSVLQIQPALGRAFTKDEDLVTGDAPVIVLGHDYWETKLALTAV